MKYLKKIKKKRLFDFDSLPKSPPYPWDISINPQLYAGGWAVSTDTKGMYVNTKPDVITAATTATDYVKLRELEELRKVIARLKEQGVLV